MYVISLTAIHVLYFHIRFLPMYVRCQKYGWFLYFLDSVLYKYVVQIYSE
jgi:hypothetical protein